MARARCATLRTRSKNTGMGVPTILGTYPPPTSRPIRREVTIQQEQRVPNPLLLLFSERHIALRNTSHGEGIGWRWHWRHTYILIVCRSRRHITTVHLRAQYCILGQRGQTLIFDILESGIVATPCKSLPFSSWNIL